MLPAYEPQIQTRDQVSAEFKAVAEKFGPLGGEALEEDFLSESLRSIRDESQHDAYFRHLAFVHQFVVAEMDTEAPSKRGIGRLADGDPPPRIGAKYRKQLRDEKARDAVGIAVERLLLSGFAAQAAFFEEVLQPREDDRTWEMWLRHLIPYYNDTSELVDLVRAEEPSSLGMTGAMMIALGGHGGDELLEAFEAHRIVKGFRKDTWRNARAMSYFSLVLGAGRALHHVLSDKVNPDFGALQSVRLLEDYTTKRSKREMVAQIKAE